VADQAPFHFFDPGLLVDGDLTLVLARRNPPDPAKGWVASYDFEMWVDGSKRPVGRVNFRAQDHPMLELYRGHIGYNVDPGHRGHHLAERSVRLLFPLMRRHGFTSVWITCNPDNRPSRRTCERLGAELVEIIPLPTTEDMHSRGDREKCRYRLDLSKNAQAK
jgi:tagatose 1,6-diphosphate aldolase